MSGLLTDLYELTMAAGYFAAGLHEQQAVFEMSIRRLPENRDYVIAAGVEQAAEYLLGLEFTGQDIEYLKSLPQFTHVKPEFFEWLRNLTFTGDLFAVPEGTPLMGGEPILNVRAPLVQAQIAETYLLSTVGFQTLVATKAARVCEAAQGRPVIEFGTRRAHSPAAGVLAGRAAYLGGCAGTSNVLTGSRYGVPVYGTAAHSWVMAFPTELEAQRNLQKLLGQRTIYLIDTYDTLEGARIAASLGHPLWGVRLDSGDLAELSRAVRVILDDAGLHSAKIMASGDLNEHKIYRLLASGAPIDAFGVGTELATSTDAPSLPFVYKLVEIGSTGARRYTAKYSDDKTTLPAAKQIFRFPDHDVIGEAHECITGPGVEALIRPVIYLGREVEPYPDLKLLRAYAAGQSRTPRPVEYSAELKSLAETAAHRQQA